jgi:TP901 family phage tail tape measure protein
MAGINFGDAFIDPKDFGAGVNELVGHITKLEKSFDRLGVEVETGAKKKIQDLSKAIRELNIVEKDAQKALMSYQDQLKKASSTNSELTAKLKELKAELAEARKNTNQLEKSSKGLEEGQKKVKRATDDVGKSTKRSSMNMIEMAQTYLRTTVTVTLLYQGLRDVVQGVKDAFNSMIEFEKSMKQVEAITGATSTQIERLENSAKNLGATTEFTASQVALLQKELGKLGFTAQEILSATAAIVDLATATGEDLTESARIAAATLRAFNMDANETERITSVMAGSFVRSGLNLQSFGQSMKFVAPVANQLNIDVETTTVLMSKLADAGLRGTQAGTSLRNIFSDLADPTSKLAQRLGFTVNNSEELTMAFRKLSDEGINFSDVTGLVDLTARQQFAIFVKQAGQMQDLQKEYRELDFEGRRLAFMMRDTLANDIEITKSALDAFGRTFFTTVDNLGKSESVFRTLNQNASTYFSRLTTSLEKFNDGSGELYDVWVTLIAPIMADLFKKAGLTSKDVDSIFPQFSVAKATLEKARDSYTLFTLEVEGAIEAQKEASKAASSVAESNEEQRKSYKETQENLANLTKSLFAEIAANEKQLETFERLEEAQFQRNESLREQITALELNKNRTDEQDHALKKLRQSLVTGEKLESDLTLARYTSIESLEVLNKLLEKYPKLQEIANKVITESGQPVTDYATKIAKLKAETEQYIATLEQQAQFNDKTLVQQAQTAQKIAARRIQDIREETRLRIEEMKVTGQQLDGDVLKQKIATENLKAQTAITKIEIGLQNQLRSLRQRQANLTNRELLAEINLEMRKNQIVKDNVLNTYDERLKAAKRFYGENATLIQTNEDREIQILNQKKADLLITAKENADDIKEINQEYEVELLEITTKYAEQKMINGRQSRDEIFKLEQEDFARRLKIRQEFEQLALADQASGNKVNQIEAENRMRMIDLDLQATKFYFGERKRLLEEQQELQLRLVSQQAALEKAQAENAFKNKLDALKQQLDSGELIQQEYEKLRLQNLLAFSNKVKEINAQTGTSIEQIQVETGLAIRGGWQKAFQEIAEFTLQITDSLFSILDQKRQADLASLQKWEDARLEYVKGNAEAEALVRLQAEEKRKAIERKQAKDNRKKALFEIAVNTAVAISRVPRDSGFFAAPIQIAALIALGAAQAAAVLASPLPEFAKGTKNAPEGYAKVDERGQELIYRRKQRKLELGQSSGERITHLDRGDQVFTATQTKQILKGDDTILPNQNMFNKVINVNSNSTRPTDEDKIIEGVSRAIKQITIEQSSFDERGFTKFIKTKSSRTQLLNKRYKF